MKKAFTSALVTIFAVTMLTITALAASYEGAIWTGKSLFPGVGYYCTAAQNRSGGDTSTHWAWARTYYSGISSYEHKIGNIRAIASSGSVPPTSGKGSYGEPGWSTSGSFNSSAWD